MRSTSGSTISDAPVNAAILGLAARFLRRDARSSSEATASSSESKNKTDAFVDTWTRFVAALALECARAVEPSRFAFSETSKSPSGSDPRRKPDDARRDRYDMDPLSYVSIRRAAAGAPSSSSLARDAWSLRRNVADRRMAKRRGVVSSTSAETLARRHFPDPADPRDEFSAATEFSAREPRTATFHKEPRSNDDDGEDGDASPAVRVALLGGALEYQRATDAPRLASFSTLLDQEHEHLRASAARALVSKPDVALVERTVARFARDLFLERGVSLAIGVGLEELRRLAFRFAPSEYSWSRSALAADGGAVRGTCAGWSVETLEETLRDETSDDETETEAHARRSVSPTTTSYMTFHGLAPGSGCVLTLRGGSSRALAAVESATRKSARAAYHLDRVAAFVSTAASSHVGQSSKASSQAKVDRFVYALLRKSVETEFTNATVQIVSRAFCPARVASVACDPPVGFRSTFPEKKLDKDKIPFSFLEIVPYGPEDLPLGAALAQAVRAERGLTECPHAKCGEHPAAHVRVFYVAGGKVTLRARRREKHEKNFFGISNQKEKGDDFLDADGGTWTYWSRCRSCLPEETRTDKDTFLSRHSEHGDAKRHFPFATPAFGSASPVAAPKRALELSLARFLELVGADVPEAVFDGLDASRLDGDCVHASPRDRAHYFASALGTVCFAFDETSPLALVVSPARDSPRSARFDARDSATERKTASSARFDARCAAAAAALRSDAYEAAMAAFGSLPTRDDDVSRLFEKTGSSDAAAVASEHVVVASVGVTAYFARQFRQARREWWTGSRRRMTQNDDSTTITEHDEDVEAVFANALSQCAYWDVGARGGKSRAFFARSNDGRFVAKQVSKTELECLLSADFAAAYFSRVSANREKNASGNETRLDSLLAATLGAFSVAPSKLSSRRDESTISPIPSAGAFDFVVLENAFFGVGDISSLNLRVYDLKGSLRGRYAVGFANDGAETKRDANDSVTREYASSSSEKEKDKDAVVLMDGNLAETCAIEPLLITRESFVSLERLIRADVAFLAKSNVMDYSLLVGIPLDVDINPPQSASGRAPRRAVVKIIDYLRMYTWDKQIESAVKSGVLSGEEAPTVLSPEKYARRFRRATRRYFLAVPDALSRESFEK